MSKGGRKTIANKTRFRILERDGFRCTYCGAFGPGVRLQLDHVVPLHAGGKDEVSNLVTACWDCNIGKNRYRLSQTNAETGNDDSGMWCCDPAVASVFGEIVL